MWQWLFCKRKRTPPANEQQALAIGVQKLRDLLAAHRFVYVPGEVGTASAGPFATGFFRRGKLELGLIVRYGHGLGWPNYSAGSGYASHADVLEELGQGAAASLVLDEFVSRAADGGDPFEALRVDLQKLILPALVESEVGFVDAINRVHARWLAKLMGKE